MLSIVAKSVPGIYAFCKNIYSIHTTLKFHDTEIPSATGVQQGYPLGSLLFCLTIQHILDRLKSELIIGYLDDVTLGGSVHSVNDDLTVIKSEGEQLGLQLNKAKCEIVTRNTLDPHIVSAFPGFQIVDIRDAQLLGCPIISDRGLDAALEAKCDEVQILICRLKYLTAHHSLIIIKHCINVSKIMHILRTNKCHDNDKLETFDIIIRAGLETILNVELSTHQWNQASLPVREGGLGVRTAVSLATSAFLASAMSSGRFPELVQVIQEQILPSVANTTDTAVVASLDRWTATTSQQPISDDLNHKQRSWDDAIIRKIKNGLTAAFTSDIQHARFLGAQSVHSGDWLNAVPIANCGLRLDDETIRLAVGVRLGTKICHTHTCPCGALVDDLGLHCFVCRKGNGKQTRHNLFNEVIWRSFLRAKIQASKEPLGTFRDKKRPDGVTLTPWQRGKCVAWDVTVADTFANSYLPLTAARAGAAAERAALNKHTKYDHLKNAYTFVPLACEVTGAWSIESIAFIDDLSKKIHAVTGDKRKKSHLFQRLSIAIQRGNAACIQCCFSETVDIVD